MAEQNNIKNQIYLFPRHANVLNPPTTCYLAAQNTKFFKKISDYVFSKQDYGFIYNCTKEIITRIITRIILPCSSAPRLICKIALVRTLDATDHFLFYC